MYTQIKKCSESLNLESIKLKNMQNLCNNKSKEITNLNKET